MSLESAGSAEVSESVSTTEAPSESKSEYSATDPGYYSGESESDVTLESLKAENETKPSSTEDDASEAESDTEGETEESPAETAESNDISDELLDRATELGYTLDEIKGFLSEKSLEKEVSRVEKLQQRLQERQAGKSPATAESATVEETEPEPNWAELIEAGHDPDVIAMQQKMWQRATNAEAMVKQVFQADQDRAWTAQSERFDETLNKLDGFAKILGNGRKGELEKGSPEHAANRQKVFTTMQILKRGYEEAGVKVPAEAELIEAAAMASFSKHTQTTARDKLKSDIKKAGSQALSRPHSSGAKPLSGHALATAKEQDFWKKHS